MTLYGQWLLKLAMKAGDQIFKGEKLCPKQNRSM